MSGVMCPNSPVTNPQSLLFNHFSQASQSSRHRRLHRPNAAAEHPGRIGEASFAQEQRVLRVAFLPTGNDFIAVSFDGAIHRFTVDLGAPKKD